MNFSKSILLMLLALAAMAGAANDVVAVARIDGSRLSHQGQPGDLRALQADPCQPEINVLVGCLNSIGALSSCVNCVDAIENDLFENDDPNDTLCTNLLPVMCNAWNNECPCGDCGDEYEDYYWGCAQVPFCGALTCPQPPVVSPTEPPRQQPTDAPTAEALPTDSPVSATGAPTAQPTIDTVCGVNNVNVVAGQSITVPPCIDNVDSVSVTEWPINGSLTVRDDGSIVYVPNAGFQGEDRFTTETCDADGNCFSATIIVQVTAAQESVPGQEEEGGDGDSGGGLAALAALALIPIVALGYLVYRKRSGGGSNGKPNGKWDEAAKVAAEPGRQQPSLPSPEVTSRVPQSSGRQSVGVYVPMAKDQVQSAVRPQAESLGVTASQDSDSAFRSSSTASRRSHDPPADPPVASQSVPASRGPDFMPDVKDQCREVVGQQHRNDTPIADAIVIDASNIEDP